MAAPAIRPQRSPELALPLPYLMAALAAFVVAAAGVPLLAPDLVRGSDDPRVFALTHVAVLGWVTMAMMGALYQLFPVALGARIHSVRLGRWNFYAYGAGVSGFVPSFFVDWTPGVAAFGVLVVGGIAHFASNLLRSYPSVRHWHPMAAYVLAGLAWLVVTMGFGLTWALDWQFHWFVITPAMLAAHVHAGLVGWLGCTWMGVSYKLMELFALAHRGRWRVAYANLILVNGALVGLDVSLVVRPASGATLVFASLLGAAAVVFACDLVALWVRRRRRPVSLEQGHVAVSLASLLLAVGLGVPLAAGATVAPSWVVAYGYAAIVGTFGFAVVGKTYKIVPFLVWLHRYSPHAGTRPLPLLTDLVDGRLGVASFALLALGYATVLAGLLSARVVWVQAGGITFLGGALCFAGAIVGVVWPGRWIGRSGPGGGPRRPAVAALPGARLDPAAVPTPPR